MPVNPPPASHIRHWIGQPDITDTTGEGGLDRFDELGIPVFREFRNIDGGQIGLADFSY